MCPTFSPSVTVRLYEELNDYLPADYRKKEFSLELNSETRVRSLLERLHILPQAVDMVMVNGLPAGLDHVLRHGDRVSAYPVFETLDISTVSRMRHAPLRKPKFIADQQLEPLKKILRSMGFDVVDQVYEQLSSEEINRLNQNRRILLTRDTALSSGTEWSRCIVIKETDPERQAQEVIQRLDLHKGPCGDKRE